jgi:hypothetical protein
MLIFGQISAYNVHGAYFWISEAQILQMQRFAKMCGHKCVVRWMVIFMVRWPDFGMAQYGSARSSMARSLICSNFGGLQQ